MTLSLKFCPSYIERCTLAKDFMIIRIDTQKYYSLSTVMSIMKIVVTAKLHFVADITCHMHTRIQFCPASKGNSWLMCVRVWNVEVY